jgi:hypothetical protein
MTRCAAQSYAQAQLQKATGAHTGQEDLAREELDGKVVDVKDLQAFTIRRRNQRLHIDSSSSII